MTETCFERKVTSHFCKERVGGIFHGIGYHATLRLSHIRDVTFGWNQG